MSREYKQLIFLFIVLILFFLGASQIEATLYFSVGLFWNWARESQLLRQRSSTKKYAYSFTRLFYFYCDLFPKKTPKLNLILNTMAVSIFIGFLAMIFRTQAPFYFAFLGAFTYEGFDLCWKKLYQEREIN